MKNFKEYSDWVVAFYKKRDWYAYNPFIRLAFLSEEVGEVSRAIRAIEIGRDRPDEDMKSNIELKENLMEELGDLLDNVIVLAHKYDLSMEELIEYHIEKLEKRFKD